MNTVDTHETAMTGLTALCLLTLSVVSCQGWFFSPREPAWNGLKTTWGLNVFSSVTFDSMPRTVGDALNDGFVKMSDCSTTGKWRGARYMKGGDQAVILVYDVKGYIAGIQTGIRIGLANGYPSQSLRPPFIEDGNSYYITAYFVDPSIICTTGRSAAEFQEQGTGTDLYIQNGTRPEDSLRMPRSQSDIVNTKWVEGMCFFTMGQHYWYDISLNMNCSNYFPVFLMYNNGKLNSFGWAFQTDLPSPRYEHPTQAVFGRFIKTVPTCLATAGPLSTLHIYLTDSVLKNRC